LIFSSGEACSNAFKSPNFGRSINFSSEAPATWLSDLSGFSAASESLFLGEV
jgi:hypothetical protein